MQCKDCGARVIEKDGRYVCTRCGLENGPVLVTTAQYYPSISITHTPLTHTSNTIIKPSLFAKTPQQAARTRRLIKATTWSFTSKERHTYRVIQRIRSYCHKLGIPRYITKTVEKKYIEAVEKKLTRRYDVDVTIASLIYLACNHYGTPRLIGDICDVISQNYKKEDRRTKSSMPLAVRQMINNIGELLNMPYKVESPTAYTWRIASEVGIPPKIVKEADNFISKYWGKDESMTGRQPQIVAGAVLAAFAKKYNLPITLQAISQHSGGTEVSIRKVEQKIERLFKKK